MDEEKIRSILEREGIDKEIKCPEAFAISEKYGISKTDIARFCNTHGVKIRACQLGCFK
ncbi:MAG TPA: hypothetical protein PLU94_05030 [Methanoregulaceae archaeon]|nr:MAG: hypothetical protein BWY93_00831 [Euryarchaeota archaeon ADurb.BinA087]HNQ25890.1 hypothetical protein [Methanoregulaceae archaeon]HPH34839.1 hypothetical protein [Methanoregulaceae archaeon]HQA80540.1 hypothetical protein [Methanoregulaceae archaeon]